MPSATLPSLDLVLIDGAHAFPAPFVDWCYTSESLKIGGLMVVDDLQLVTPRILADFMRADQRWAEVRRDHRFAVYRKLVHPLRDERDWLAQAWVSGSNPVAAVRVIRAGPLRRVASLAARACAEPGARDSRASPVASLAQTRDVRLTRWRASGTVRQSPRGGAAR